MSDPVQLVSHGSITEVAICRPEAFNAFDMELLVQLAARLTDLAATPAVRGLVLTGRGKAFCAGGDLKYVTGHAKGAAAAFHALAGQFHQAVLEIRRMPKPVVAAIHGVAAGGGFSLALACDFRVMETGAVLRQAYTSAGLSIDGGGTFALPRLVGLAKALEIAAFDEPIPAEKALQWGLVTRVVPDGESLSAAVELAERVGDRSLNAFSLAKRLLTDSFDTPFEKRLEQERRLLSDAADHPHGHEGLKAFVEKRKPDFVSTSK
jgi:2-(1,2-epoxy-1,2-dihydrophenyl)acetyl-CoA isomerase